MAHHHTSCFVTCFVIYLVVSTMHQEYGGSAAQQHVEPDLDSICNAPQNHPTRHHRNITLAPVQAYLTAVLRTSGLISFLSLFHLFFFVFGRLHLQIKARCGGLIKQPSQTLLLQNGGRDVSEREWRVLRSRMRLCAVNPDLP